MLKRDPIFWWATGIFVLSLVLFGVFRNQFWLALMIGSYLLRPTLASLGLAKRYVDERQLSVHYRSGNVAFAVMTITCVVCMVVLGAQDNHDFELFAVTIIVGMAAKGLFNVILGRSFRGAASTIIISAGLLIALFSSFDGGSALGTLISIAPGLLIAGLGLVSRKYPRTIGVIMLVATVAIVWEILTPSWRWGQVSTAIIIGVPLMLASVGLLVPDRVEEEAAVPQS